MSRRTSNPGDAPPLTPMQTRQALVPELVPNPGPADTAERLLLLLHYSIDWDSSWVAQEKYRKAYWDRLLPLRVRRASYRAETLDQWWSEVSTALGASAPRGRDRRLELAQLLRADPLPVLNVMHTSLPALLLRVRIIAEAVADQRKAPNA